MTTPPTPRILTVDDDPDLTALIAVHLRRWDYRASTVDSAAALWRCLESSGPPDVLLLDVMLGDADGSHLVARIKERFPDLPVIMITRSTSVEAAVRCMKHGAADYLSKPIDFDRLRGAVGAALEWHRFRQRSRAEGDPAATAGLRGLLGESPAMMELVRKIRAVAPTEVSALILGETGTGKELVARAIHLESERADGPFVAVNAAAVPHELIESALFGHAKGAFTGAHRRHLGHCEAADGGTLFLDEIGEMDFEVQAKLLRFLQDHRVQPVGSSTARQVDVRVLAATNIDPLEQIARRALREDLYYRLRVVSLALPPLRERAGDIARLAEHFLQRAAERHGAPFRRLAPDALAALERHPWPGNVRQLENAMEEAVVLHRQGPGPELPAALLPEEIRHPVEALDSGGAAPPHLTPAQQAERRALLQALARHGGDVEAAAVALGISRATAYRRLKAYRVPRPGNAG